MPQVRRKGPWGAPEISPPSAIHRSKPRMRAEVIKAFLGTPADGGLSGVAHEFWLRPLARFRRRNFDHVYRISIPFALYWTKALRPSSEQATQRAASLRENKRSVPRTEPNLSRKKNKKKSVNNLTAGLCRISFPKGRMRVPARPNQGVPRG